MSKRMDSEFKNGKILLYMKAIGRMEKAQVSVN